MKKYKGLGIGLFIQIFMLIYAVVVLLPICWVIITSLKTNKEFFASPWGIFEQPQFVNYANAWIKVNFKTYTLNSIFMTVSVVIFSTIVATTASYVLVRFKFKLADPILTFFISGLYIPIVLILPFEFLLLNDLKLVDTRTGLMITYTALTLPYSILVISGFLKSIPKEMEEAAFIDGCSYNETFWRIIVPISRNGITTMAIFNLLWVWNDYIIAMTVIIRDEKKTLPIGIIGLMESFKLRADWVTLFAGLVIVMLPTIIVYAIFQKKLEAGLTLGAVKG